MSSRYIRRGLIMLVTLALICISLTACQSGSSGPVEVTKVSDMRIVDKVTQSPSGTASVNTIEILNAALIPAGTTTTGNDSITIDTSNSNQGFIVASYHGSNSKLKLQITGPDSLTYTYNINNTTASLPLTAGDGSYLIELYENIGSDQYALAYSGNIDIKLDNIYGPFLYPNIYVDFDSSSKAILLAKDLVSSTTSDLEYVEQVYHYVTTNISYDYDEAATVSFDYLPVVDEVLNTKKGICFDYAALMAAMLRSQGVPTRMQIGYAGEAYHAWISVYIEDIGWIDGIIQFDGAKWTLMDPTFASTGNGSADSKKFIGDGSNYKVLYTY